MTTGYVRAKAGFVITLDNGRRHAIKGGEVLPATSPVVKGRAHLFEEVEADAEALATRIETANAVPERRTARSTKDAKSKSKAAKAKARTKAKAKASAGSDS